jgi:hypothetical protein
MPLDRQHITRAARILLVPTALFSLGVGLTWIRTPESRLLASPGLAYADALLTLRAWGGLFLAAGLLMVAAMLTRNRLAYRAAVLFTFITLVIWSGVLVLAAFDSQTSPSAWQWPAQIACACLALYASLTDTASDDTGT